MGFIPKSAKLIGEGMMGQFRDINKKISGVPIGVKTYEGLSEFVESDERILDHIRNEYVTIGRTEENAEYFTEGASSFLNESSRDYFNNNKVPQL